MPFSKSVRLFCAFAFISSNFVASSFAEDVAIQCEILETPTSAHDSWAITILNNRAAFFDNNDFNYATLVKTTETDGGSEYQTFKSTNKDDPFRINLDSPDGLYGKYAHETISAELYLGKQHRPNIFICKKTSVKEAQEAFED